MMNKGLIYLNLKYGWLFAGTVTVLLITLIPHIFLNIVDMVESTMCLQSSSEQKISLPEAVNTITFKEII